MASEDEARPADAERLVNQAATFNRMSAAERAIEAGRLDLTDDEQLALAAFADDPDVASAIEANPSMCDAALGVAHAMRRQSRPWWQRRFRR
jgi:hypothetical protein